MSIITVTNLSHTFGGRKILEDVNFRLLKGEHVGFIGANGEGKSSFLNIITSKLLPDEGKIVWAKRVHVGVLDQHAVLEKGRSIRDCLRQAFAFLFEAEQELNEMYGQMADEAADLDFLMQETAVIQEMLEQHDFYMIDAKIDEVARGIGLFDLGLDRDVDSLSGGQRTKILLAKLLLQKPDVLLLDEPTNYLDEEHILWLKKYLLNYENAFILITHDMEFLNEVVNLIYHIENYTLNRYVGNYDEFIRLYELSKEKLLSAYEKQQSEINDLKDFIARNKARVATSNMAKSRQKKLDKMDIIELSKEKRKPEFNFKAARTSDKMIYECDGLVIGYSEPLTRQIDFLFERGDRVAIIGSNGLGKTTLLKSLMGLLPPISGNVGKGGNQFLGYFEQEIVNHSTNTCIEEIWSTFPSLTQSEVRASLAKCGLTTEQLENKVYVLSGGEQAKVRLCKIINTETNILVLDEPTNHLDVEAKNELKRALKAYKGSILMVCHEPEFYNEIVHKVWDCKDYTLKIF